MTVATTTWFVLACSKENFAETIRRADQLAETTDTFDELLAQVAAAPDVEPAVRLRVGEIIDERFEVKSVLGSGGMGRVYLARDTQLNRDVAIKVLSGISTEAALDRLLEEARSMAALAHPNVVTIHEVGSVKGSLFLAMEHMPEGSLRAYIASTPEPEPAEVVARFVEAGRGLAAAHAAGLIHRDFKPDNVLLGKGRRACVADFGLARNALAAQDSARNLAKGSPTHEHTVDSSGTPAYMAPEQLAGKTVDARVDQFSFCVALWEALVGEMPFEGTDRSDVPAPPKRLPAPVRRVLVRGLSPDPLDRFESMNDLLEELEPRASTDPWKLILIAGTLVFAAAAVIFMLVGREAAGDQRCTFEDEVGAQLKANTESIRRAFSSSTLSYAPALLATIETELPKRVGELASARSAACKATKHESALSDALYGLALACFEDNERRLLAQISRWSKADDTVIKAADKALVRLPEPAQCLEVSALVGRPAPPPTAQADKVRGLTRELETAKGLRELGQLEPAKTKVESVIEAATELGYAPLIAQALHERGAIARLQSQTSEATELLQKAYVAAQQGEAKALETIIAGELAYALAIGGADAKSATLWRDLLEVAANKGIGGPTVEFRALDMLGAIYDFQGDYKKALEFRERARSLALEKRADAPLIVAKAEGNMGLSWHALGKLNKAVESYEKALAILEQAVGALHPQRAVLLANAGLANAELGNTTAATAQLSAALAISREVYGERSIEAGYTLLNLGIAYQSGDKLDEAIAIYDESLEIVVEQLGAEHPDVALVHNSLSTAFEAKGDYQAALVASARARAIFEAKDLDHPEIARIVYNQATVRKKMGDLQAALRLHRDAIARWDKVGEDSPYVAAPLIAVAEILIDGGKLADAKTALTRAKTMASQLSDEQNKRIAELLAKTER